MQHIPDEVQHPIKRLQQNYQTQHSQEVAKKENILAAQEEKRTTPGESSTWPDHDQPVSGGNNPPARQSTLPRSTMPGRLFAPPSSRPVPPPVSRQPGQREGAATGQAPPSRQPGLPRRPMLRQPTDQYSAVGQNQKNPEINRTTNRSVSRQDKLTSISSEKLSDNMLSYSSDRSPLLPNNKQSIQSKTIMVVDDSQTVRNIMALILNRSGYHSIRVSSSMEALHKLTELIPDFIFLDITLPGMDGIDTCKIIKKNPRTKQVPVVMLSGNNTVFDKVMGRLAGASDYITKPFEPESILMCIQTFLEKK